MRLVSIVGHSGSGKTHLIVRLIGHCSALGLRVASAKHTHHHDFFVDQPGKDSWRHREAGAVETLLVSDRQFAHFGNREASLDLRDLLGRWQPCDLVLLEGFKQIADLPKIEVFRAANAEPPLALDDPTILALAALRDDSLPEIAGTTRLDLNDTAGIAEFLLELPPARPKSSARRAGPAARLAHIRSR